MEEKNRYQHLKDCSPRLHATNLIKNKTLDIDV